MHTHVHTSALKEFKIYNPQFNFFFNKVSYNNLFPSYIEFIRKNIRFCNTFLIAKPAEIDFEQSLLSIFDCRKAINYTQNLYYQILLANCCQKYDKAC